jgi:hypothetical protein
MVKPLLDQKSLGGIKKFEMDQVRKKAIIPITHANK